MMTIYIERQRCLLPHCTVLYTDNDEAEKCWSNNEDALQVLLESNCIIRRWGAKLAIERVSYNTITMGAYLPISSAAYLAEVPKDDNQTYPKCTVFDTS